MRCPTVSARGVLAILLAIPLALPVVQPTSAEDLPQYKVRRTEEVKTVVPAGATEVPDFQLLFPAGQLPQVDPAVLIEDEAPLALRPTNRRNGAWNQFWPQAQAAPALFAPDDDRPLKPLTGQWTENSVWQPALVGQPNSPQGFRFNNLIIPVAAEEPLDSTEKCNKCNKCDECKCNPCNGKQCGETPLEHGETAKVILELMETLGRSVLDGTVFQKPGQADQDWLKELSADGQISPREALIQYIRHLESQEDQVRSRLAAQSEFNVDIDIELASPPRSKSPCGCPGESCPALTRQASTCQAGACPASCRDCPAECAECFDCPSDGFVCTASADQVPCLHDAAGSEVDVYREMSVHLEMAANELERREVYQRADQLREVAGQLRQDARRASVARAARKTVPATHSLPKHPHGDVQAQLHELREELRRTQMQLEQAQQIYSPRR